MYPLSTEMHFHTHCHVKGVHILLDDVIEALLQHPSTFNLATYWASNFSSSIQQHTSKRDMTFELVTCEIIFLATMIMSSDTSCVLHQPR